MKRLLLSLMVVVVLAIALACYSAPATSPTPAESPTTTPPPVTSPTTVTPSSTPTPSPSPTVTQSPSPSPTLSPSPTVTGVKAGELAKAGKTVYASRCASCHGAQGQGGPAAAVIGANARLDKFNTAEGLFDYESRTMPASSPGSLSQQEYLEILGFLLVQNSYVTEDTPIDAASLDAILLKK